MNNVMTHVWDCVSGAWSIKIQLTGEAEEEQRKTSEETWVGVFSLKTGGVLYTAAERGERKCFETQQHTHILHTLAACLQVIFLQGYHNFLMNKSKMYRTLVFYRDCCPQTKYRGASNLHSLQCPTGGTPTINHPLKYIIPFLGKYNLNLLLMFLFSMNAYSNCTMQIGKQTLTLS